MMTQTDIQTEVTSKSDWLGTSQWLSAHVGWRQSHVETVVHCIKRTENTLQPAIWQSQAWHVNAGSKRQVANLPESPWLSSCKLRREYVEFQLRNTLTGHALKSIAEMMLICRTYGR